MKKLLLSVVAIFILSVVIYGQNHKMTGPDGKLVVEVAINAGIPVYSISYNGQIFLLPSPLGLKTNAGDFSGDLTMSAKMSSQLIDEHYSLPNIKKSDVHYQANETVVSFFKADKPVFDVIFRISNNDVAYRYCVHPHNERLSCVVKEENSGFVFPQGTTTFLCPQSKPMVGFARSMPSYETEYTADDSMGKNGRDNNGFTFPCLFRVGTRGWVLISESGVDSRYCGSRLIGHSDGSYSIGFPMEAENNGNGTASPGIPLPGFTPWRTITMGETLNPIVESTVAFDVVEPLYKASKKYEYTKGTWSWIMKMDGATVFNVQKEYIDFSATMGYNTVLVDALWDTQIGRKKIEELAAYGASKNVSLYLWYNSNGYWNDAPQGPRGLMDNIIVRRREMAWLKSIGVKGIKVDFFGGDKQVSMKLYEDILADANDFGLMVIFHGCTIPRGWERMYPNYAASEAVRASENLHFDQRNCDNEAFNACLHPFIRNSVGSMDFGGCALNKFYNADNTTGKGSKRMTSEVFALAISVLFQSGVQHFALAPNNLSDAPGWAMDFMKTVPTTWDDICFIDGYPGKYVIIARRHADKWYVAGVSAQKQTLRIKVKLPMFAAGTQLKMYHDDAQLNGELKSLTINKKQEVDVSIPCNGGLLITE